MLSLTRQILQIGNRHTTSCTEIDDVRNARRNRDNDAAALADVGIGNDIEK